MGLVTSDHVVNGLQVHLPGKQEEKTTALCRTVCHFTQLCMPVLSPGLRTDTQAVSSLGSSGCEKGTVTKKGVCLAYTSRHSLSSREVGAQTQGGILKQELRAWRSAAHWHAPPVCSFICNPGQPAWGATAHGGVAPPPPLIINEENAPQDCLYANLMEDFLN